jgi:hypothetical protein
MRLIFIHGFGENPSIFNQIAPQLPQTQVFVNVWNELGNEPREGETVVDFAKQLVKSFSITATDWVIGHSMGGWIALHIKAECGCKIVQIASWTEPSRFNVPVRHYGTIAWLVRNGLYLNRFTKKIFELGYRGLPSAEVFSQTFQDLIDGPKENVVNQVRLMFNLPKPLVTLEPELRIHAKKDRVILYPKTSTVVEVPGDHFTLITHPETVVEAIMEALNK